MSGLEFASAISGAKRSEVAQAEVLGALDEGLADGADLAMVFATAHFGDVLGRIGEQLGSRLGASVVLGVTGMGVLGADREIDDGEPGLSVVAGKLPGVRLQPFAYEQIDWAAALDDPESLQETMLGRGVTMDEVRLVAILADPSSTPVLSLLPAVGRGLPGVPIIGGMASGDFGTGKNRLLIDGKVVGEGAVGVGMSGPVRVDCTVSQGCRAVGRPMVITKSQRHIVRELGGRNPLKVIREVIAELNDEDRDLVQQRGLVVGRVIDEYKDHFGRGDFLIRHLVGIDEDSGHVAINDPQVRVGQTIQFHVHDQRAAGEDFQLMLEGQKLHGPAAGAMLFTCSGRGQQLFERPNADVGFVREALGEVPMAGFFAAGEIGPVGGQNFVHGHTASLAVFRQPLEHEDPPV